MTSRNGIDLMAHLMRRAGFGASRSELEQLSETRYETVADQLLRPEEQPELDKIDGKGDGGVSHGRLATAG